LVVTNFALSPPQRGILKDVFLHELGHVLGLRHEFAGDSKRQVKKHQGKLGVHESEDGAVRFMQRNKKSVMSYTMPPSMQQTDKDQVRAFYSLKEGE
ncbi:hypothetical protein BGZ57DRAFT_737377, partial [Hyaloscypha finlandica]